MPLKLLAVGDLHLGRRPSRLPAELASRGRSLGPSGSWDRTVTAAIAERVDAVALAGDVVDRDDDFFEALRDLQTGVERLVAAGIRVLGVAGNHDVTVLPQLVEQIDSFELLGAGGRWQRVCLESGGTMLHLWGWSFPQTQVFTSPLTGVDFDRPPGVNLGLLHCNRDQPGSPYAPVPRRELEGAGLDGWLLGHVHQPDALSAPHPSGYLGCVTGMNPGEPGARGPWLLTMEGGRIEEITQWVLAPLRWERLEVDIAGIPDPGQDSGEVRKRLLSRVRELDAEVNKAYRLPDAVGLRVKLTGRTRFGEKAAELFSEEERAHIHGGQEGTHYFIERLEVLTQPEVELAELAKTADPPGLLARRLLLLDEPAEHVGRRKLLAEAQDKLSEQSRKATWQGLRLNPPDEAAVALWLRRSGMRLLEKLLAQQGESA